MVHVYSPVRASSEASLSTAGRGTDQAAVCRVSSRAAESECVGPPTGPQALEAFSVKVSRSSPSISSASPVVAAGTCTTSVTSVVSAGTSTASVCCVMWVRCLQARAARSARIASPTKDASLLLSSRCESLCSRAHHDDSFRRSSDVSPRQFKPEYSKAQLVLQVNLYMYFFLHVCARQPPAQPYLRGIAPCCAQPTIRRGLGQAAVCTH